MERQPAVHAARHGDRAGVQPEGHGVVTLGAQTVGVGAGTGPTGGHRARAGGSGPGVDEGEEVATHAAQVGSGHRQHRVGSRSPRRPPILPPRAPRDRPGWRASRPWPPSRSGRAPSSRGRAAVRQARRASGRSARRRPATRPRCGRVERSRGPGPCAATPATSVLTRASVPTWLSKGPVPWAWTTKVASDRSASGDRVLSVSDTT